MKAIQKHLYFLLFGIIFVLVSLSLNKFSEFDFWKTSTFLIGVIGLLIGLFWPFKDSKKSSGKNS